MLELKIAGLLVAGLQHYNTIERIGNLLIWIKIFLNNSAVYDKDKGRK